MLVTADNLTQLFFGWEGVGLCSYLLIGYWYDRPGRLRRRDQGVRRQPHRRPAVRRRHGADLLQVRLGRVRRPSSPPSRSTRPTPTTCSAPTFPAIEVIGFLLFIGAMGKSAQLGLHVWLPDAMEGPTPVSALIHAATMVTAGVFLMARMSPLMEYAPARWASSPSSAPRPRCSPPRSAARRTTSSGSSPIRPARSLATCSSPPASAPIRCRSST